MIRYEHLTQDSAACLLRQGKSLQQWLGVRENDGFRFIHWVEIDAANNTWEIYDKDSLDSGAAGNSDLTSFHNDNDPDSPEGMMYLCDSVESVFSKCVELGCALDKFVRFCEIQYIYDGFIEANGLAVRGSDEYFSRR